MSIMRSMFLSGSLFAFCVAVIGCTPAEKPYGREQTLVSPAKRRLTWAICPVVNLSGEKGVDPFLQADLVFQQLKVEGITPLPVNLVAEVYATLHIERISSPAQAALVCDLLHCDGLILTTVTTYDSYNPPKLGAAMQLFIKPTTFTRPPNVDPRELARRATPEKVDPMPDGADIVQAVGMFDAINGSVRDRLHRFVAGRSEKLGPLGEKEYYVVMDRYCEFAYTELIEQLLLSPKMKAL